MTATDDRHRLAIIATSHVACITPVMMMGQTEHDQSCALHQCNSSRLFLTAGIMTDELWPGWDVDDNALATQMVWQRQGLITLVR